MIASLTVTPRPPSPGLPGEPGVNRAALGEAGRWQSIAGLSLPAAGGAITAYWALATPQAGW
jgi:hypothetical protein